MPLQADRPVEIKTPLGDDALIFRSMTGTERLGRPFEFDLTLLSTDEKLKSQDLVGKKMTVRLTLPQDKQRFFNGYVSRFSHAGRDGGYARYQATLRPWIWLLTRKIDCRIFQEKSAPDIIKLLFREFDFGDFDDALTGSYPTYNYCAQYRESTFDFVSRLMEQEGIYYHFRHADDRHTLVLADGYGSHEPIPGFESVPFFPPSENVVRPDHVHGWTVSHEIRSGAAAIQDFNFETPRVNLMARSENPKQHALDKFEAYDYPGAYGVKGDGDAYVKKRLEELQAEHELLDGEGDFRGCASGGLFKLTDHSRSDQNREYLVVAATHELNNAGFESGSGGEAPTYGCRFSAIDSKVQYRSPRITPQPVVQGPQTAIVVGKSGEEIWTDEYGRVKVQFHWDREGKKDENSSCWVRVAQVWAGNSWGAMHIPRMGQEVIVDFLEGDPDRPIITGRVYNADEMPPYALPDNQTQSGIKSRSTKDGGPDDFNELRFEDKKGEEQIYFHAQKDFVQIVENDRAEDIGHDRSLHVGHDKSEKIDNNKSIEVGADHSETIGAKKTLDVGASHTESIGTNMTITIGTMLTETVGANYAETVGGAMELSIGGAFIETVGAAKAETIGGVKTSNVGGSFSENVGSDKGEEYGASQNTRVSKDRNLEIGKNLDVRVTEDATVVIDKKHGLTAKSVTVTGNDEISLISGSAKIVLKKSGDIVIEGKNITIKGSADVTIKGSKIAGN